jgi:Putative transposase
VWVLCQPAAGCRKRSAGAVSFIQRFDSALRLNLHIHTLDGVYAADDEGKPQFQVLLAPDNEEIERLAASLAERIPKFLQYRGLGQDSNPEESDPFSRGEPWLSGLYAASVSGRVAFGSNAGRRVTRAGDQIDPDSMDTLASARCASVSGFSLHANVAVHAGDRPRLERGIR